MSDEVANKLLGKPGRFFDRKTGAYFNFQMPAPAGPFMEIHTRITPENEYEIRIEYAADVSESRLHPTLRASLIGIKLDHPESLSAVLMELPEIRELCSYPCKAQVFREGFLVDPPGKKPSLFCFSGVLENLCFGSTDGTDTFRSVEQMSDIVSSVVIQPPSDLKKQIGCSVKDRGTWSSASR